MSVRLRIRVFRLRQLSVRFAIASPVGYQFDGAFVAQLKKGVPLVDLLQTADLAAPKPLTPDHGVLW